MDVRDLLGYATIRMTEKYAHLAPERVREAVAVLEDRSRFGHGPGHAQQKSGHDGIVTA